MTSSKRAYRAPNLTKHGSLESLTKGGSFQGILDQNFPAGTPSSFGLFS